MSLVVLPSFQMTEDNLEALLAAGRADAESSVTTETGCLQFDIGIDREARPIEVVFCDVCSDRSACEAHLQSPHLATFRQGLHWCVEGPIRFFESLVP